MAKNYRLNLVRCRKVLNVVVCARMFAARWRIPLNTDPKLS